MTPHEVHRVLTRIGVRHLYHANTVTTSCTFLEHGALLSRGYVEHHKLTQTDQASDVCDKKFRIWDAVFLDHVDIHQRAGRKKGPNQYGPVLFVLDVDLLLRLPSGTDIRVTRSNPVHWNERQTEEDRWYLKAEDLSQSLGYGDFDKMLVIATADGRVDFPGVELRVMLDNPKRPLSDGTDAYTHAEQRLKGAAEIGGVRIVVAPHECRTDCACEAKYGSYSQTFFESRFL